jgi:hypothetical protein
MLIWSDGIPQHLVTLISTKRLTPYDVNLPHRLFSCNLFLGGIFLTENKGVSLMVNVLCYFNGANIRKIYDTAKSNQKKRLSKKALWNAGGSPASTCKADEPSALQLFRQPLFNSYNQGVTS